MIVAGFFQEVFDRIIIESVRTALGDAIRRRVRESVASGRACAVARLASWKPVVMEPPRCGRA
jgi:hypothetical protein